MLFNSLSYAIFLPIVFGLYWLMAKQYRWVLLLAASYYFYMSWNVKYVTLILFTTAISYACARLLERATSERQKKVYLTAALVVSLGILFVYKYFNFFFDGLDALCRTFAIPLAPVTLKLLLPVGISFYTFQTLSYVIDVYRGKVAAERNFGVYATFISFFPQLVAGPIERTERLLPQIKEYHTFDYDQASYGAKLMAWGFFKKMVIADVLAGYVNVVYDNIQNYQGFALLLAAFFFSIQIYCDFSGYSDIAIGTAKCFGIELMTNFKSPYLAVSIADFWARWHISLSTWFRDYLYIPLGGNRCGKCKQARNLLITFLVSGLWHGANITFLLWGGVHGVAQIIENFCFGKQAKKAQAQKKSGLVFWLRVIFVFAFCCFAWVFFRANSVADIGYFFTNCFTGVLAFPQYIMAGLQVHALLNVTALLPIVLSVGALFAYDYASLSIDPIEWVSCKPFALRWGVYLMVMFFVLISPANSSEFVYFQF